MKQSILLKIFINFKFISHLWNVYREIWFHTAATGSSRYLIVWRKGKKKKLPNKLIILVFLFFLSPFLVSFIHLTDHLMLTRSMLRGLMPSHLTFTVPHTRSSSINVKLRRTRVLPISHLSASYSANLIKLIDPFFLNHALHCFILHWKIESNTTTFEQTFKQCKRIQTCVSFKKKMRKRKYI